MATAKVVISDKIEFTFTYTFNASYSDTSARASAYVSSAKSAALSHSYVGVLALLVDGELVGGLGSLSISKAGVVSLDSSGTVNAPISKTHSSATHKIGFNVALAANDGSDVSHNKTTTVSVTVPAKTSYKITFDANGGSGGPSSQTKWHDEALSLTTSKPTRTGYTFSHWDTKDDGSGTNYSSGGTYPAGNNAPATLHAYWNIVKYTITYNANGGSGAPTAQTKNYGATVTISSASPSRTGYNFGGWYSNTSGTGTNYAGTQYSTNANLTLYAKWTKKTYTVSYSASGATNVPSSQTKTHDTALKLSTTVPTKTNYVFKEWRTNSDGSGTRYSPGDSYTANAAMTLYAQWYAPYTVSYNANGGSGAPAAQTKIYNQTLTLTTAKPSTYKQNCSFNGWNTKADGSGTNYASGASYTGNANLTLYAKWTTAYASPTVSITKIYRADSSGNASDEGTYLALEGTYTVYNTGSNSHSWSANCNNVTATSPASGGTAKSGSYKFVINANLSTSSSYSATITLTDNASGAPGVGSVPGNHSATTASQTKSIGSAAYPIDIGKFTAGYGVAFNGLASRAAMDIGFADTHFGDVSASSMRLMAHTQHRDGKIIEVKPNTTNGDGDVMLIGAGGPTFIGGGESDTNLYAALGITPTSNEDLYLASDGMIKLYTNCQTIANRKYCWLGTEGTAGVRQALNTYSNNTDVVIGTSSNNGVNENKTIGSLYLRDNSGTWAGVFGARTDSSSGDIHAYIGANNTKTDGTTVQAYLDVIVQKDGTKRYSVSDAGAFRNALGASSGVWPSSQIPNLDGSKITSGTVAAARLPTASTSASGIITAAEKAKLNALSVGSAIYYTQNADTSGKRWRMLLTNAGNLRVDESADSGSNWTTKGYAPLIANARTENYYSADASRTANTVLAAPNGSAGTASFRKLVAADIPTLTMSKISDAGTLAKKDSGTVAADADTTTVSKTETYSVAASGTATVQFTGISADNHTFMGIRRLTTGAQSAVGVIGWYLDGTTLNVYLKNFSTSAQNSKTCALVACFVKTAGMTRTVSFS